jgi:hypothetical protein
MYICSLKSLFLLSEDLLTCHNTDEATITKCAANFLKFVPERIGGGGRGDNLKLFNVS